MLALYTYGYIEVWRGVSFYLGKEVQILEAVKRNSLHAFVICGRLNARRGLGHKMHEYEKTNHAFQTLPSGGHLRHLRR